MIVILYGDVEIDVFALIQLLLHAKEEVTHFHGVHVQLLFGIGYRMVFHVDEHWQILRSQFLKAITHV